MTLETLIRRIQRTVHLSTDRFAEILTYKTAGGRQFRVAAHVRHTVRFQAGDGTAIEQVRITIDSEQLDRAPKINDRVLIDNDDRVYVYRFAGRHNKASWKGTFERAQVKQHAGRTQ